MPISHQDCKDLIEGMLRDLGRPAFRSVSIGVAHFRRFSAAFRKDRIVFCDGSMQCLEKVWGDRASTAGIRKLHESPWHHAVTSWEVTKQEILDRRLVNLTCVRQPEALIKLANSLDADLPGEFLSDDHESFVVALRGDWMRQAVTNNPADPDVFKIYIDLTWKPACWKKWGQNRLKLDEDIVVGHIGDCSVCLFDPI